MPLFAQRQIIKHGQPADNKVTTRKCYQLNKEVHNCPVPIGNGLSNVRHGYLIIYELILYLICSVDFLIQSNH